MIATDWERRLRERDVSQRVAIAALLSSGDATGTVGLRPLLLEFREAWLAAHQFLESACIRSDFQVMHATGIGRRLQAQLARRIAAQYVPLQHAIAHQRRFACGHAFAIECGGT